MLNISNPLEYLLLKLINTHYPSEFKSSRKCYYIWTPEIAYPVCVRNTIYFSFGGLDHFCLDGSVVLNTFTRRDVDERIASRHIAPRHTCCVVLAPFSMHNSGHNRSTLSLAATVFRTCVIRCFIFIKLEILTCLWWPCFHKYWTKCIFHSILKICVRFIFFSRTLPSFSYFKGVRSSWVHFI